MFCKDKSKQGLDFQIVSVQQSVVSVEQRHIVTKWLFLIQEKLLSLSIGTESTVHYFLILDTCEAINLFKLYLLLFNIRCYLISLLFISIFLVCIFSVLMILLVEIHVKGFLWKCAKNTSIYGQNHKVAILDTFNKGKTRRCNLKHLAKHPHQTVFM